MDTLKENIIKKIKDKLNGVNEPPEIPESIHKIIYDYFSHKDFDKAYKDISRRLDFDRLDKLYKKLDSYLQKNDYKDEHFKLIKDIIGMAKTDRYHDDKKYTTIGSPFMRGPLK